MKKTTQLQELESLEELEALQRGDKIKILYCQNNNEPEELEVAVQTPGTPKNLFQFVMPHPNSIVIPRIRMYSSQKDRITYDKQKKIICLHENSTTINNFDYENKPSLNLRQTLEFAGMIE